MFNRLYKDHAGEVRSLFVTSLISYFRYLLIAGVCLFLHALFSRLKIDWMAIVCYGIFFLCSLFYVPYFAFFRKSENGYHFMGVMLEIFGEFTPVGWLEEHNAPDFLLYPFVLFAMFVPYCILALPVYLLWIYCPVLVELLAAGL